MPKPRRETSATPTRGTSMLRFVAVFVGAAVVLFGVYWVIEVSRLFHNVNVLNAILSGALLEVFGVDNARNGTVLTFRRGGMEVISECSGVYIGILFAAGVLAFPSPWRARLLGLAVGLPLIFAINVLRLTTLGAIIAYKSAWLPLFHEYLWQVFFILVVAVLYLMWIERMVPRGKAHPAT